ncbi:MAG TPA: hypothetical protein VGC66_08325 [Pyrinomonadaceae bacterium]|jgi:tetratricopeptide (TPR) repeat protein
MNSSAFNNGIDLPETPYKGLMPYDEGDAPFFFGREQERKIITANLIASRFTLLYGPSGVGKSSVLRAGVSHHLHNQALQNMESRGKPRQAIVVFKEWRSEPLKALLDEIESAVRKVLSGREVKTPPSTLSFEETLKAWSEQVEGKLYIILDQFEEYFLYPQKEGKGSFAYEFPRAVNNPGLRVNFLVSLRDDWLSKLDRFKTDIPHLFDNYLRIERLGRLATRSAIEKPIAKYNELRIKKGLQPAVIEDGFSERVINQLSKLADENVHGVSGQGVAQDSVQGAAVTETGIQTPYLQLVLKRLWNEAAQHEPPILRVEMLDDPERAKKIVQSHVDEVMESLEEGQRREMSKVFYHLVTPSGTKIAQKASDLAVFAGVPESELVKVLDLLTTKESGILTQVAPAPGQENKPRYEIAHDVLAYAVLAWTNEQEKAEAGRLAAQEAAEREAQARIELKHAQELAEAQRQRADEQRLYLKAEQRRSRQFKISFVIVLALLIGMVGLTIYAFQQRASAIAATVKAEEAKKTALIAQGQAEEQKGIAEGRAQSEVKAKNEAVDARKTADDALSIAEQEKARALSAAQIAEARRREAVAAKDREAIAKKEQKKQRDLADQRADDAKKAEGRALEAKGKAEQTLEADLLYREAFALARGDDRSKQLAITKLNNARDIYRRLKPSATQPDTLPLRFADTATLRGAEVSTLLNKGTVYLDLYQESKAEDAFVEALGMDHSTDDPYLEAGTLSNIAAIYRDQSAASIRSKAIDYYQRALEKYQEVSKLNSKDTRYEQAGTLFSIAYTYGMISRVSAEQEKQDNLKSAIEYYEKAQAGFRNVGNKPSEAMTLYYRSTLYDYDDTKEAMETVVKLLTESRNLYQYAGDLTDAVLAQRKIANVYMAHAEYGKALDAYIKTAEYYEQLNDRETLAGLQSYIGGRYLSSGDGVNALKYLQKAIDNYRTLETPKSNNRPFTIAGTLVDIGNSYYLVNEREKANAAFQEALKTVRQMQNIDYEARILFYIGTSLIVRKDKEGLTYEEQGIQVLQRLGDQTRLGDYLNKVGGDYLEYDAQRAIALFNQALSIFQQSSNQERIANTLEKLGQAYIKINENLRAIEHLERAAQAYLQGKNKFMASRAYYMIRDIYSDMGNTQKAEEYRQKAQDVER